MGMTIAELLELDREGELSTLTPVTDDVLKSIAAQYPGISKQYLAFIRAVGTGSTKTGSYIYEPEPASSVEQHQSFQIYNGVPYQKLYKWFSGKEPKRDRIPADAIMVADSAASWRYCLCPSLGDGVFCLDMAGPTFEIDSEDFFTFVARGLIYASEIEDDG